jgi:hypothetical protein
MMLDPGTIHLYSRNLVLAGFALAFLTTLVRKYWGYSLFSLIGFVETYLRLRYGFHGWARDALLGPNPPTGAKEALQAKLLYVSGGSGLLVLLLLLPYLGGTTAGRRSMTIGALVIVAMLTLELISPHYIDAIIYHPEGPVLRSAIAYFIGTAFIAVGALLTPRRPRPLRAIDV